MAKRILTGALCAAALFSGCGSKPSQSFEQFTDSFTRGSLALSPAAATAAGLHEHGGVKLDERLDDWSAQGVASQIAAWRGWQDTLKGFDPARLSPAEQEDHELIGTQIAVALFELETAASYRYNPTLYVELVGNALFVPFTSEYAPQQDRFRHIVRRLEAVPALLEQAKKNLQESNPVWVKVAIEENEGNLALIEKTLHPAAPAALRMQFDQAALAALASMRGFNQFLTTLPQGRPEGWRLGSERYGAKFRLVMGGLMTPDQLLAEAEAELAAVRRRMFQLAGPLHTRWFPAHKHPVEINALVREVLDRIAAQHARAEDYFNATRTALEEARAFAAGGDFLRMPEGNNLQLIETPAHMRGIYGVGGFNPAPPLEPRLGAHYWLTPIPAEWPAARKESKLREYNDYGLRILTLHEAIPGHYVQFEYANRVQPAARRLLRSVYGSGVYIEGWAVYATELMLDEGYLDNSAELRLTFLKQMLRALANAILDIRMHTGNLSDGEAMALLTERTFQEEEEATAKLVRAKLSSCQLPTYYTGYKLWKSLRLSYQRVKGESFSARDFHARALGAGALPMTALNRSLVGAGATTAGTGSAK